MVSDITVLVLGKPENCSIHFAISMSSHNDTDVRNFFGGVGRGVKAVVIFSLMGKETGNRKLLGCTF